MARHDTYYDQKGNSLIIDGTQIQDFADGESIRINPNADQASFTIGLDGATINLANNLAVTVEVDLKATSISNDYLSGLLAQQQETFLDLAGTVIDGSGAVHSFTGGAIFKAAAAATGGPAMGKRGWIIGFTKRDMDR